MDSQPHILVVDDHQEIRTLLQRFLTDHEYRVTTASNGMEMKKRLQDAAIDLIVLDLMMPGEDGLTLCRNLRAESNIPVIMLTAMGEETDRIIGLEMGADDYLAKPFNPRELLARIKAVMRRMGSVPEAG
ncbi:MAG: response regulator, partial [Candidatus Thiodiazotropha taylori]